MGIIDKLENLKPVNTWRPYIPHCGIFLSEFHVLEGPRKEQDGINYKNSNFVFLTSTNLHNSPHLSKR